MVKAFVYNTWAAYIRELNKWRPLRCLLNNFAHFIYWIKTCMSYLSVWFLHGASLDDKVPVQRQFSSLHPLALHWDQNQWMVTSILPSTSTKSIQFLLLQQFQKISVTCFTRYFDYVIKSVNQRHILRLIANAYLISSSNSHSCWCFHWTFDNCSVCKLRNTLA